MHFTKKEKYLCASRITGPRHNYIEIELSTGEQLIPVCERLKPVGDCRHEPLDEAEIIARVQEGVAEANIRFSKNFCVNHIRYIENDTKPELIYGVLVLKIITHLEQGGIFQMAQEVSAK